MILRLILCLVTSSSYWNWGCETGERIELDPLTQKEKYCER